MVSPHYFNGERIYRLLSVLSNHVLASTVAGMLTIPSLVLQSLVAGAMCLVGLGHDSPPFLHVILSSASLAAAAGTADVMRLAETRSLRCAGWRAPPTHPTGVSCGLRPKMITWTRLNAKSLQSADAGFM